MNKKLNGGQIEEIGQCAERNTRGGCNFDLMPLCKECSIWKDKQSHVEDTEEWKLWQTLAGIGSFVAIWLACFFGFAVLFSNTNNIISEEKLLLSGIIGFFVTTAVFLGIFYFKRRKKDA